LWRLPHLFAGGYHEVGACTAPFVRMRLPMRQLPLEHPDWNVVQRNSKERLDPSGTTALRRLVAVALAVAVSQYAAVGTRRDCDGHVAAGYATFGPIEPAAVERNVARQFLARDEIERQFAAAQR
jgi:hypothetical protein